VPTDMTETNEYGETVMKTAGVWAQCLTCSKKFKYHGELRGEVAMCKKYGVGVRCPECQSWGCEVAEDAEPAGADEES
jgi:acetyl-CoA carboxylase beta subunit